LKRIIFHVDVNSAFLSWEAVYRLKYLGGTVDLREIPAMIGGDMSKRHGIVLAKSMSAKGFGIRTGETLVEARRKCPHLYMAAPNYGLYERSSKALMDILKNYTPDVEQYSIDEAFMDMTGMQNLFGEPVRAANEIKDRIHRELGFTVNIGISTNKVLAKMAGELRKPNLVHTIFPEEVEDKLWPLPVRELFFVGRATERKLLTLGITTIGELAKTDLSILRCHLKKHGEVVWNFANGNDFSVVQTEPIPNKGYGNSTTIAFDVTDANTAKLVLLALAETVGTRLRKNQVRAEIIAIGIKSYELKYESHQMVLNSPTNITGEIHKVACKLFDEAWNGTPVRHLGIHTSRIKEKDGNRQINMFDTTDYDKLERIDEAVDSIRRRHGIDAVKRAVFIKSPIDHLSGGISREKRSVDYDKLKID